MTSDELWQALRNVDQQIKDAGKPKSQLSLNDEDEDYDDDYQNALELGWHLDELRDQRKEIIQTFIDGHGYNPDNLATSSNPDQAHEDAIHQLGEDINPNGGKCPQCGSYEGGGYDCPECGYGSNLY